MSAGAIIAIAVIARCHWDSPDAVSQAMAGEDQHRGHEPDHQPVCGLAAGVWHSRTRGSEVGEGLSN